MLFTFYHRPSLYQNFMGGYQLPQLWAKDHEMILVGRWVCLAWCGGLLAIVGLLDCYW